MTSVEEVVAGFKNDILRHRKEIWIAEAKIETLNEVIWKLESIP